MSRARLKPVPIAIVLAALVLGGCAGEPSRQAAQSGRTEPPGVLDALQTYQRSGVHDAGGQRTRKPSPLVPATNELAAAPLVSKPEEPLPTREPARIMRIWIAPWEDAEGNLHGASHVYTELTPRRWHLDAADRGAAAPVLTPLQIEPRTAPQKPR
jgi:conjugal transfer pilus assembly protein TraV